MGLLDLADFRERVVALYRDGPQDGEEGALDWRRRREELFRSHPESPLAAQPGAAPGYFDYDADAVVETRLEPTEGGIEVDTGGEDGVVRYARIGVVDTPFGALTLFWTRGYGGGLFLPVRDAVGAGELRRRALPDRHDQGHLRARRAPASGRRGRRHARLQLPLQPLLRLRRTLAVPARPAREPARAADPGGGAGLPAAYLTYPVSRR